MKQLSPIASLIILATCFGLFVAGALLVYKRDKPEQKARANANQKELSSSTANAIVDSPSDPPDIAPNAIASQSAKGEERHDTTRVDIRNEHSDQSHYVAPGHSELTGSEACGKCHAGILETYKKHPMYFGSTRLVSNDSPSPSDSGEIKGKLKTLSATTRNGDMVHSETVYDTNGEEIFSKQHPMKYVVGSGRRAKAYVEQRGGLLCLSPLNWFGKTKSWGLNPGYSVDDPRGFDRKALANCLLCHTGTIKTQGPHSDMYQEEPFGELAIGCERCHGAGRKHIDFHEQKQTGIDPIVNPELLEEDARQAICYQCHLQPSTARILKEGRSHQDFKPGMKLEDVWLVLDTESGVDRDGRTKSVRHVQQMHDSQCFKKSGTMRCTTCHDPHSVPSETDRVAIYRDACLKCHSPKPGASVCSETEEKRGEIGDSCYECHMPSRDLDLSSHASQSDHRIIRRQDQPSEGASPLPQQLSFFGELSSSISENTRRRAMAIYSVRNLGPNVSLYRELEHLAKIFPEDGMTNLSYGLAAMTQNQPKVAIDAWTKASAHDESQEFALEALIQMSQRVSAWDKTIEFSEKLIRVNPYHPVAYTNLADALMREGRVTEAMAAAKKGIEVDPLSLVCYSILVDTHRQRGEDEEASKWQIVRDRVAEKLRQSR